VDTHDSRKRNSSIVNRLDYILAPPLTGIHGYPNSRTDSLWA
jgi:hypothetical protein